MRFWLPLTFFLAIVIGLQERYPHTPVKEKVTFDFNEGFPTFTVETLRALSFGYSFAASSALWLRFMQHTPPRSMGANEVSWIYLDLNNISLIDPDFAPVYSHGAMYLSVITEDKLGARLLLERGVEKFPGFWRYRAYLAYHYNHELGLPKLAAEQYRVAADLPGSPPFFRALAATLLLSSDDSAAVIAEIRSMLEGATDPLIRKRLEDKLAKAESRRVQK